MLCLPLAKARSCLSLLALFSLLWETPKIWHEKFQLYRGWYDVSDWSVLCECSKQSGSQISVKLNVRHPSPESFRWNPSHGSFEGETKMIKLNACSMREFCLFRVLYISYRPRLKRRSSRWDQETSKKYKRTGESAKLDQSQGDSNQENKEDSLGVSLLPEERNPISLHHEEFSTIDSSSVQEEHTTSDSLSVKKQAKTQQTENSIVLVHENEINCSAALSTRNQLSVKLDNETDFLRVSRYSSLHMKRTHSETETLSSPVWRSARSKWNWCYCGEGPWSRQEEFSRWTGNFVWKSMVKKALL